ncbi:hypothetical protein P9112_013238 [Eukaryota sp. TZLM1-RC]
MVKPVLSSLLLPTTLFVCLLSRQSYFLFAFVPSLFLAIKLPNQKWPPLLSFALSFFGLVASAVTIPFDLPLLQSLYIGTCSDSLCIPPFAYYGSLVFVLFIYLRLQPSSSTLSSHVPLLSNVYLKTILILLSFSFVPTPTYFVFFTLISLVLSSPTSPLLSHNLYHKIFSICSFSHLYYILLSSTLSLPYFHDPSTLLPLPVSFFSTLHILTLILSIYLHSSPYFFSPHHRIPQADSVEPSLISLSFVPDTTASISVASVISFFSCGLVLIATFFYLSPWLIPLLIYGMILIIFKLRTCGFKRGYRVLLFSIISINLTFISFLNNQEL